MVLLLEMMRARFVSERLFGLVVVVNGTEPVVRIEGSIYGLVWSNLIGVLCKIFEVSLDYACLDMSCVYDINKFVSLRCLVSDILY